MPLRKKTKSIYELSPVKGLKVGGIPLMTLTGVVGIVFIASQLYLDFTTPSLGLAAPTALTYVVGVYAVLAIYYFAARAYRKRQGINLGLTFAQIPPE